MTLGDQMVVIAHQNIPVQRDVVAIERFNKQLHELRAIGFVGENPLPGIAPGQLNDKERLQIQPVKASP